MHITEHINSSRISHAALSQEKNSMRDIMRHKIDAPQPGCHALSFILL